MKALIYEKANTFKDFAIRLADEPEPDLRDTDVLVEVRAIGINPGEAFIRSTRSAELGGHVLLGWEFAGVVIEIGSAVRGFRIGDRVFGTGDISRDGCWAEYAAVDHRIIAKIPDRLTFVDAASLPVGTITAWEAMFRDQTTLAPGIDRVLVIGGAGAVGSLATQLLKAKTDAFVISTGSRPESRDWCREMGADLVIDHTKDIAGQLTTENIQHVDMVLSTAGINENLGWITNILRPFGHLSIVDLSPSLDVSHIMTKSISLHTEMVFSRILSGIDLGSQGSILKTVTELVDKECLRPITTTQIDGLTAESISAAHELVETRRTIGKVVITI